MNLLYISSHRFIIDQNNAIYTTGTMTNSFFNKLNKYFDKIYLICTCENLNNNNKTKIVEKVDFNKSYIVCNYIILKNSNFLQREVSVKSLIPKYIQFCDFVSVKAPAFILNYIVNICKKNNKKLLVDMVGCPLDSLWYYGNIKAKLLAPVLYYKTKKAIKQTPYVVYVTNEFLQRRYPTKGLNEGISDVQLRSNDIHFRLSKSFNLVKNSKNKTILGSAGGIDVKYKGHRFVLKAISYLKKLGYGNIEYQLAGGGDKTYIQNIASKYNVLDNLKIIGPISHSKIFDWYDSLDIYIQPSLTEGLPRALVEAMSRGLPCIGSSTGGIPELLSKKMIFSKHALNKGKIIANMLLSLDSNVLLEESMKNYKKSKEFSKEALTKKRDKFMKSILY